MKKTVFLSILTTMVVFIANAQIVNIPDPVFKNFLINHHYSTNPTGIGTEIYLDANHDGEIQYSEAASYTSDIYSHQFLMNGLGISDLTGIEAFASIQTISVLNNNLTSINITGCSALTTLDCSNNPFTSLTINNGSLQVLTVNSCPQLTSLDIHSCQNIKTFTCQQNSNLTTLNLAGCRFLQTLKINYNPLLTSLDFGSFVYSDLTLFQCYNNGLTSLDVSHCIALQNLFCTGNQLTSLNLANGHPQSFQQIYAEGYPNLFCIQVDNVTVSQVLWGVGYPYQFDSWATFSTDCANYNPNPVCTVNIPDANLKAALLSNTAINTNANNEIECTEATAYTGTINVDGLNISDMTGIEAFVNITSLSCSNQQTSYGGYSAYLDTLNISGLTSLTNISCTGNIALSHFKASGCTSLTDIVISTSLMTGISIDLSNCTSLSSLNLSSQNVNALNISGCSALTSLNCSNNLLTALDLNSNVALTTLNCANNHLTVLTTFNNTNLTAIDCSQNQLPYFITALNTGLVTLNCSYNNLTYLDVNNNTLLMQLNCSHNSLNSISANNNLVLNNMDCSYNNLTAINVNADTALTALECSYNHLTNLDVSNISGLQILRCGYNTLPGINVSDNLALTTLFCAGNNMPALDVSKNLVLKTLDCSYNQLSSLYLSTNSQLLQLTCSYNPLTTLDLQNNSMLIYLYCEHTQLTALDLSNTHVIILSCDSNQYLQALNVANGYNTSVIYIYANDNPQLTCVLVDSVAFSYAHWTANNFFLFDAGVVFSKTCGTLPLTLLEFTATQIDNKKVSVKWITTNEINTKSFSIERSKDGTAWTGLGNMAALNTVRPNNYFFNDIHPFEGINYYRLKMIDKDGKFILSPVRTVNIDNSNLSFIIAPNPASAYANIYFRQVVKSAEISVIDAEGRKLFTNVIKNTGTSTFQLKTDMLASGVYLVYVKTDLGDFIEKLLIHKL